MAKKITLNSKLNIKKFKELAAEWYNVCGNAVKFEKAARLELIKSITEAKKVSDLKNVAEAYLDAVFLKADAVSKYDIITMQTVVDISGAQLSTPKTGHYYKWRWKYDSIWRVVYISEDMDKNQYLNYVGGSVPLSMHHLNINDYEYIEIFMPD